MNPHLQEHHKAMVNGKISVTYNSGTQSGSGTALEVLWTHSGSTLKLALWTGLLLAPTCRMVRHPVGLRIH